MRVRSLLSSSVGPCSAQSTASLHAHPKDFTQGSNIAEAALQGFHAATSLLQSIH